MCRECLNCPKRSIESNCHNVDTCPHWAAHMEEVEKKRRREAEQRMLSVPKARYSKCRDVYVKGDYKKNRRAGG